MGQHMPSHAFLQQDRTPGGKTCAPRIRHAVSGHGRLSHYADTLLTSYVRQVRFSLEFNLVARSARGRAVATLPPDPHAHTDSSRCSMDSTGLPSVGTSSTSEQEDAQPLLGNRCSVTCEDASERVREDEGVLTRVRRVLWWRRMLRPGEVSGSLGDLGTFLPDVVALSNNPLGAYPVPASFVFFSGAWSLISGCSYDMPLPLQPMHTVVAVTLTEGLTYAETVAAGVWLGAAFLVLGATGLVCR